MAAKSHNIAITVPFRDSTPYLSDFIERVSDLDYPSDNIRIFCIEGDSEDDTWDVLTNWALSDKRVKLLRYNTGAPKYSSSVDPERFRHLAGVFNTCLEAAIADDWADYVCLIPSDVMFGPDLLKGLLVHRKDYIAPMYWKGDHPSGARFYDIWGYEGLNGQRFPPASFAWYTANFPQDTATQVKTVGGAILVKRQVIDDGCRYTPEAVDRGLCQMATDKGYTIWVDPQTHIIHR